MDKIYVVIGATGEYGDHRDWMVKAFLSKEKAQAFVEDVSAIARELYAALSSKFDYYRLRGMNPLDPNMDCDYTGVRYHYCEVDLEE